MSPTTIRRITAPRLAVCPAAWRGVPRCAAAVATLIALACVALACGAQAQQTANTVAPPTVPAAPETRISAIEFQGLARVDSALVRDAIRLSVGDPLFPSRVTESVQSLYALGLFDRVDVEVAERGVGEAAIVFQLLERPTIREVTYSGHEFYSAEDLKAQTDVEPGDLLVPAKVHAAGQAIKAAYREEGFPQADVLPEVVPDSVGRTVTVRFHIDEQSRVKVRRVFFEGNDQIEDDRLRGEIKTNTSGFLRRGRYKPEQLAEDVTRLEDFYHNHGFKDARVDLLEPRYRPDGAGVEIGFEVAEGDQYRFAAPAWNGQTVFDGQELLEATAFVGGDPYNESQIDETIAAVASLYTERGYLTQLRIDPLMTVRGDSVQVTFRVLEGQPSRVGEIRIVGNTATKEKVIRRELKMFPGSLLRRSLLLRSQRDVFALGHFEDVQVEFEPSEREDHVDVIFRVKEKSSVLATAGAGYSSQAGLTGFIEFGHTNLFGNGQSISLKLEHGGRRDFYDLSFTEPWVFGRPVSAGIDLYRTELFREIYSTSSADDGYWQKRGGAGFRIGHPWFFEFPDYSRFSWGYSYTDTRYTDIGGLSLETQDLLRASEGSISRVFLSFYRNSTDNPFHPRLGARTTLRTELNGGPFGGDMDYYRITLDHRQYYVPFWKPVLMLRWRFGLIDTYSTNDRMPEGDRFRLGGTTGFDFLRGYKDYYLVPEENVYLSSATGNDVRFPGGRVMFGFTSEIQFPIVDPLHGVLFLDAADTWNSPYDATLSALKFGVGAGVTLEIPMLGPLGFYYGYGNETRKWITHFAFGTQL